MSTETPSLVRVVHKGTEGTFIDGDYRLPPGGEAEVPKEVAARWCGHMSWGKPRVVIAGSAEDKEIRSALETARADNASLKEKIAKLEAKLAAANATPADEEAKPATPKKK